jgi:arylsulfatase A-like enzyme
MLNGVPQKPIEGFSVVYTFDNPKPKSVHRTQYFEMFGNRAIYSDGWVAATTPPILPWVASGDNSKAERFDVSLRPSLTKAAPSSPTILVWSASLKAAHRMTVEVSARVDSRY